MATTTEKTQQPMEMPTTPDPSQHIVSPEPAHAHPASGPAPYETQQTKGQQQQQPQIQPDGSAMPTSYATPLSGLGTMPAIIDCPFCHQRTKTRIEEHSSSMTIITGIGIGCLCICLACLPCMLGWFQDVDHYCVSCNQRVAFVADGRPAQVIAPANNVPQQYHMGSQPQYGQQPQQSQPQQQGQYQPPAQQQQQQQQHQEHPPQQQSHANAPPQYEQ
ncbi:hypothetical protein PG993_014765 [Apiospora rasikravindrae]|uniref:LITAF domain-containing protein n=1 Tax=Apiospora rasikravindrae TaxID=990691 RepID=A0ABR1RNN9_9PEZI